MTKHSLVTDFVPSEMACLASSPGRINRTDVWISREEIVDFFEYAASSTKSPINPSETLIIESHLLDASVAIRSKISLTKLFNIAIALLEIPVSGWTCLRTRTKRNGVKNKAVNWLNSSSHVPL